MIALTFLAFACLGAFIVAFYYLMRFSLASMIQQGASALHFVLELIRQNKCGKLNARAKQVLIGLAAVGLVFISAQAFAVPTQIFDQVAQGYKTTAATWFSPLHAFALRLFWLLASLEVAWHGVTLVLGRDDYQSFTASLTKKLMGISFFYMLLLYANTWIPAIINSFVLAGQAASGSGGLSPSDVITRGLDLAFKIFDSVSFLGLDLASAAAVGLVCMLLAIIIALAFATIGIQLFVALVESYAVVSAGILFLGFGGSRWTRDFVQKYIGYAVATGTKLFMLYLIVGAGMQLTSNFVNELQQATNNNEILHGSLTVLIGALTFAALAWKIPAMAASMLAGSPSLTAGEVGGIAGGMVAGGIAGAAMGGQGIAKLAEAARYGSGAGASTAPGGSTGNLAGAVSTLGTGTNTAPAAPSLSPTPSAPAATQVEGKSGASAPAGATAANSIGAPGNTGNAPTPQANRNSPGILDGLRNVRPPQLPNDAAGAATVHILLDGGRD